MNKSDSIKRSLVLFSSSFCISSILEYFFLLSYGYTTHAASFDKLIINPLIAFGYFFWDPNAGIWNFLIGPLFIIISSIIISIIFYTLHLKSEINKTIFTISLVIFLTLLAFLLLIN